MKVYQAIAAVAADIAAVGVGKTRMNEAQRFRFRGIDDVMNALAGPLARHKLLILPRHLTRTLTERASQKGGALFYAVVESEFDLVSAEDGSKHTVRAFGEGMDSADKATNKAMAAAYKYAAFQAFCIPTEGQGDVDADAESHQAAAQTQKSPVVPAETRLSAALAALSNADAADRVFSIDKRVKAEALQFSWPAELIERWAAARDEKLNQLGLPAEAA